MAVAAVVLSLGGCGSSGKPRAAPPDATVLVTGATSTTVQRAVKEQTVQVGKAFWYAGFKVTVKAAALRNGRGQYGGAATPVVAMTANFENTGVARDRFDGDTVLQSAGRNYFDTADGQDIPEVPGGANQDGTIVIAVDATFRFDDAVLVVGTPDTNQPRIPLTRADGLVAFEPRGVPLTGKLTTVSLVVELRRAELRGDHPRLHRQVPAGHLALRIDYGSTLSGCSIATVTFDFTLVLPDGTSTDAFDIGQGGQPENDAWFLVGDRPAGAYTLKMTGQTHGSTGPRCPADVSAETRFTIA